MDQINQIKQALDIVDVVGKYVQLKKSGHSYKGLCPFHSEDTPSFMVSQELQIFKCFGCQEGGDIFKFIEKIEGLEFPQALEHLAEKAGIVLEKREYDHSSDVRKRIFEINEFAARFYHYILLKHPAGKQGLDYIKDRRGLSLETIKSFEIGFAPENYTSLRDFLLKKGFKENELITSGILVYTNDGKRTIDKFRGRVVFPLKGIDGKVLGFMGRTIFDIKPKYLNSPETPVFHKGSFVFALDKARLEIKKEGAVVVEGPMDVISAYQAGFKNFIATSGTALTSDQLKLLSRYSNNVTFCFDSDGAGINAAYHAIDLAEKQNFNIKVAVIPSGYKDMDELVTKAPTLAKDVFAKSVSAYDFFYSDAFSKFDKKSAQGKKDIIEHLAPLFSRISNKILFEHYTKKLSEDLNLDIETVITVMGKGASSIEYPTSYGQTTPEKPSPESYRPSTFGYFLAVTTKADIDTQRKYAYKLSSQDINEPILTGIFECYFEYLQKETKSFNIKSVLKRLDAEQVSILQDLYLWDLNSVLDLSNPEQLEKELESIFKRIKKESTKFALTELTEKIKLAELSNDLKKVEALSKEAEKLKETLI